MLDPNFCVIKWLLGLIVLSVTLLDVNDSGVANVVTINFQVHLSAKSINGIVIIVGRVVIVILNYKNQL